MSAPDTYESATSGLRIKIVGVGGAGNNAADRLKLDDLASVHLVNLNTDKKTLSASPVSDKVMIGRGVTRGLSAGGEADVGRQAAEADREIILQTLRGVDLVFLLVGLGGGTGSGAAPIVAQCARDEGAVVITFATLPFSREGVRRMKQAEDALHLLRESCDAVITLPNDVLVQEIPDDATLLDAFSLADNWIKRGVLALWSMLFRDGLINVDFATLRQAFSARGGKTLFGLGFGEGPDYVASALRSLEMCPLLHLPENRYIRKADSLIVNILGGPDLTMARVNEIMDFVTDRFGSKDNTVLGAVIDGSMSSRVEITVIGTTAVESTNRRYHSVPAASNPEPSRRAAPAARPEASNLPAHAESTPGPAAAEQPAAHDNFAPSGKISHHAIRQNEFDFPRIEDSRGHFDKTDPNLFEGVDLDVPTYLRRGIKIALH